MCKLPRQLRLCFYVNEAGSKRLFGATLSALGAIFLIAAGAVNLVLPRLTEPDMVASAFPLWTGPIIGGISLMSGILYAIPRTAMLGAILSTGFLGGAIATHLRLGEIGSPPQLISLVAGLIVWYGLWIRGRVPVFGSPGPAAPVFHR